MTKPTVAILGASQNREKYGNKSVRAHLDQGYEVYPINPNADEIEGLKAYPGLSDLPVQTLDRVSVYLPPAVGLNVLDDIKKLSPKEVWFNPGSESDEILDKAQELGLNIIMACSIVDLGVSPRQYPG
jgi:predicted CoA-binding protein